VVKEIYIDYLLILSDTAIEGYLEINFPLRRSDTYIALLSLPRPFPLLQQSKRRKIQISSQPTPREYHNLVLTLSAGRCSSLFFGFSFDFDRGEDPSTSIPSSSDPSSDSESDSTSSFVSGMIGWIGHALSFESSPPVRRILFCSAKCY